jgi:hypothetical protein
METTICKYAKIQEYRSNKNQIIKEKCPRLNEYYTRVGTTYHHNTLYPSQSYVTCIPCKTEKLLNFVNITINIRKVTKKLKRAAISFDSHLQFHLNNNFCINIAPPKSDFFFILNENNNYWSNIRDPELTQYIRYKTIEKIKSKEYTLKLDINFICIWLILHKKWNLLPDIIQVIYRFLFC